MPEERVNKERRDHLKRGPVKADPLEDYFPLHSGLREGLSGQKLHILADGVYPWEVNV